MIEHARNRGVYESLAVEDVETALAKPGPTYDLILAADTLVYLGAVVVVGLIAMASTFIPARAATRVDPAIALRAE